ncbi:hypothetical protein, partial [Mycobacterium sp.]|uniref:hypothetical protein n=1 Tax=Mycobacterium sp. TaxID=1785 RepID=UPI003F9B8A0C
MTESSDTPDTPAKPQDYAGLRAELATLVNDFSPLITELWPRLEDHKYRWELHIYGLRDGYHKVVVTDIIGTTSAPTERKPSGVDTGRRCGGGLPVRPVGWGGSGGGGSRAIRSL